MIKYIVQTRGAFIVRNCALIISLLFIVPACEEFLQIDPPKKELDASSVFNEKSTADAAVLGMYDRLIDSGLDVARTTGLAGDELINYNLFDQNQIAFYENRILPNNLIISSNLWFDFYNIIFRANSIIEGLSAPTKIPHEATLHLKGEALFIRAFCHFYLVNLFGEVPLVTTTDYRLNRTRSKSSMDEVYESIITDLNEAKALMNENYLDATRVRANSFTASALLARVYLYREDWEAAENEAMRVINSGMYSLNTDLKTIGAANNAEAILQIFPSSAFINSYEGLRFIPTQAPPFNFALTPNVVNSFEPSDKRLTNWVGSISNATTTYYYPFKYRVRSSSTVTEYSTVFRLSEQYLIRSEAKARQNKLSDAISDLDVIRARAGLELIAQANPGISQADLLNTILIERDHELFTEWGLHWFDLKRTVRIDAQVASVKPDWQSTDAIFPIPESELQVNPSMTQNPGY